MAYSGSRYGSAGPRYSGSQYNSTSLFPSRHTMDWGSNASRRMSTDRTPSPFTRTRTRAASPPTRRHRSLSAHRSSSPARRTSWVMSDQYPLTGERGASRSSCSSGLFVDENRASSSRSMYGGGINRYSRHLASVDEDTLGSRFRYDSATGYHDASPPRRISTRSPLRDAYRSSYGGPSRRLTSTPSPTRPRSPPLGARSRSRLGSSRRVFEMSSLFDYEPSSSARRSVARYGDGGGSFSSLRYDGSGRRNRYY